MRWIQIRPDKLDWIILDQMRSNDIRWDQIRSDTTMWEQKRSDKITSDYIRWQMIRWGQMRSDQMIKFNQMIKTLTQLLWDMPNQPLWLPLVSKHFIQISPVSVCLFVCHILWQTWHMPTFQPLIKIMTKTFSIWSLGSTKYIHNVMYDSVLWSA